MSHLVNAYNFDRELWKDSCSNLSGDEFSPWLFRENSIKLGSHTTLLSPHVSQMLALFDVFSSSAIHGQAGVSDAKGQLSMYYSKLRTRIANELTKSLSGKPWEVVPDSMSPWSWRVSLGFFNHDEKDDKIMTLLMENIQLYEHLFPSKRKYTNGGNNLSNDCAH